MLRWECTFSIFTVCLLTGGKPSFGATLRLHKTEEGDNDSIDLDHVLNKLAKDEEVVLNKIRNVGKRFNVPQNGGKFKRNLSENIKNVGIAEDLANNNLVSGNKENEWKLTNHKTNEKQVLIDSLQNGAFTDSVSINSQVVTVDNGELFEGDIIMDNRFRRALLKEKAKKSALLNGDFFFGLVSKWPDGIIYYEIGDFFIHRTLLEEAIREFERRTCIRFKENIFWQRENYIVFSSQESVCSSSVGMAGGRQVIYLGEQCGILGTVQHEIMHVLGIIHEHSRPDRDKYIKVNYGNVIREDVNNFQKYQYYDVDDLEQGFNFASIMLYRNDAFTRNGEDTIEAIGEPDLLFGQREQFSVGDVKEISTLYNCRENLKHPYYRGLVKNHHGRHGHVQKVKHVNIGFLERWMKTLQKLFAGMNFFSAF